MHNLERVTLKHVDQVYRTEMLGPPGQSQMAHYESRLGNALDEDTYRIALEILTEAATQGVFDGQARRCLESLYTPAFPNVHQCVADALDVLVHDGYLAGREGDGWRFELRLLKDWWVTRFGDHYVRLVDRNADSMGGSF